MISKLLCVGLLTLTAAAPAGWTGTWATPMAGVDAGRSFTRQMVRQVVHVSVGGRGVRVRLSNRLGNGPLVVAAVHVARRATGAAIVTGTDRVAHFGGAGTVTIPPGESAVSDPVDLAVPPLSDLAVSLFLPGPTGPATGHGQARQTSYVAAGDVAGRPDLPGATTIHQWAYLTNVDVRGDGGAVVVLGASIVNGLGSTDDANRRWPDVLAGRLAAAHLPVGVLNAGVSGNHLLDDGGGPSATARFDRDALDQPGVRWVIFADCPINDLGTVKPMPTAAALIVGVRRLSDRAHARGVRFVPATLTPFAGAGSWSPAAESARQAYNRFARDSAHNRCDGLVDADAATRDPDRPARLRPAYDVGDHLHLNDAGLRAIGSAVDLDLFRPASAKP